MTTTIITTVISSLTAACVSGVIVYVKGVHKKDTAIKEGMLSLLRAEIIRQHDQIHSKAILPHLC